MSWSRAGCHDRTQIRPRRRSRTNPTTAALAYHRLSRAPAIPNEPDRRRTRRASVQPRGAQRSVGTRAHRTNPTAAARTVHRFQPRAVDRRTNPTASATGRVAVSTRAHRTNPTASVAADSGFGRPLRRPNGPGRGISRGGRAAVSTRRHRTNPRHQRRHPQRFSHPLGRPNEPDGHRIRTRHASVQPPAATTERNRRPPYPHAPCIGSAARCDDRTNPRPGRACMDARLPIADACSVGGFQPGGRKL
jgi:hypothetical protein